MNSPSTAPPLSFSASCPSWPLALVLGAIHTQSEPKLFNKIFATARYSLILVLLIHRCSLPGVTFKCSSWSMATSHIPFSTRYYAVSATLIPWGAKRTKAIGDKRCGERISTGFVESAVNQVIAKRMEKKQQMRWTPKGAHLLLQVRTKVLNDEWKNTIREWYPRAGPVEEMPMAA